MVMITLTPSFAEIAPAVSGFAGIAPAVSGVVPTPTLSPAPRHHEEPEFSSVMKLATTFSLVQSRLRFLLVFFILFVLCVSLVQHSRRTQFPFVRSVIRATTVILHGSQIRWD